MERDLGLLVEDDEDVLEALIDMSKESLVEREPQRVFHGKIFTHKADIQPAVTGLPEGEFLIIAVQTFEMATGVIDHFRDRLRFVCSDRNIISVGMRLLNAGEQVVLRAKNGDPQKQEPCVEIPNVTLFTGLPDGLDRETLESLRIAVMIKPNIDFSGI